MLVNNLMLVLGSGAVIKKFGNEYYKSAAMFVADAFETTGDLRGGGLLKNSKGKIFQFRINVRKDAVLTTSVHIGSNISFGVTGNPDDKRLERFFDAISFLNEYYEIIPPDGYSTLTEMAGAFDDIETVRCVRLSSN